MSGNALIEEALVNLNKQYQKLDYHKETVTQQADKVKDQIRQNIQMQIEALNQRRQWLLNQVDLIRSDKMESIHRQQEVGKCSMRALRGLLADNAKYSSAQIKEKLDNIKAVITADTQPFIAFRADSALLREIISQYGSVLKQYSGHWADPSRPSLSLPHVVEEEDDEDHISFGKKETLNSRNDDIDVLHVNRFPTNAAVVKSWLLSSNEAVDFEMDTLKSDCDSFIKLGSSNESFDSKKQLSLLDTKEHRSSDIQKHFSTVWQQSNTKWLVDGNEIDEDKEPDQTVLVSKACIGGGCRSFNDCCEKENCCSRLIDPCRPSWNKWLIDNNILQPDMISITADHQSQKSMFCGKFDSVLKSNNTEWVDKRHHQQQPHEGIRKQPRIDETAGKKRPSVLGQPLDKWIVWGREQEWTVNKYSLTGLVEKSLEQVTIEDTIDGLKEEAEDSGKWLSSGGR